MANNFKYKTITPLARIGEWFLQLPNYMSLEISALMGPLHYDELIRSAGTDSGARTWLLLFLGEENMISYQTNITRSLFMINLIDYCLYSPVSPLFWKSSDITEQAIENEIDLNGLAPDQKKALIELLVDRKSTWIMSCQHWAVIKDNFLSTEMIAAYEHMERLNEIKIPALKIVS